MQRTTPATTSNRSFEYLFAITGLIVCVLLSMLVRSRIAGQQPVPPLGEIYMTEMVALSLLVAISIVQDYAHAGVITWSVAGAQLGLAYIGAWSIGLAYIPSALLFVCAGIRFDRRRRQSIILHLALAILAAATQAAAMLIIVRLETRNAFF